MGDAALLVLLFPRGMVLAAEQIAAEPSSKENGLDPNGVRLA